IQSYMRDQSIGLLSQLKVAIHPHLRLFGADDDTVYFRHLTLGQPFVIERVGGLVLAYPPSSRNDLALALRDAPFEIVEIGDCLSLRTGEEAVLEGLTAGAAV